MVVIVHNIVIMNDNPTLTMTEELLARLVAQLVIRGLWLFACKTIFLTNHYTKFLCSILESCHQCSPQGQLEINQFNSTIEAKYK